MSKSQHYFTKEQDQEVARLHLSGMRIKPIARLMGVHPQMIMVSLKYEGIKQIPFKRLHVKENAFEDFTEESACYWLGFIYADGYVNRHSGFAIKLKAGDRDHLAKLGKYLELANPPRETKSLATGKMYKQFHIGCSNKKFINKLINLGITTGRPNPLLAIKNIPNNMLHHFFRGLFDGDGCAHKHPGITFLSQKELLSVLRKELIEIAKVSSTRKVYEIGKICRLDYGGYYQATKIRDYLYKDASVYLERKHDIAFSWNHQSYLTKS